MKKIISHFVFSCPLVSLTERAVHLETLQHIKE
nr:MAG TPA: hypothetical protein [Caudoviricetes sp.]